MTRHQPVPDSEQVSGSRFTVGIALAFALLVVATYLPALVGNRSFGGRDLTVYNLPLEKMIHDAFARGRLPLWSAEISGGRPLLPNPNTGSLYPVRVLFSRLPFATAIRIFPVLHWTLSGIGLLLLLRSTGRSPAASWIGAVTYVFSGVGVGQVFFPHTQPGVTLLPWILWALQRSSKRPGGKTLILSLLLALDFLAGDVFTAGLAIAGCIFWIVLEEPPGSRLAVGRTLGVALALAALLALPQILATALWIPETSRAVQGIRLGDALFFSVPPVRLLELIVPYPFGPTWALDPTLSWAPAVFHGKSLGIFSTLYCGALAPIALLSTGKPFSRAARTGLALFALGLLGSVLPSLIPAGWAQAESPVALRNPEKLSVATVLGLSILAAVFFDRLPLRLRASRRVLAVGGALAALATAAALFPTRTAALAASLPGSGSQLAQAASRELPGSIAQAGLLWMATLVALDLLGKDGRSSRIAALALLTAVPMAATRSIAQTFRQEEFLAPTAFARWLEHRDPKGQFRTLGESLYRPDSALTSEGIGSDWALIDFARRDWYRYTPALWGRGMVFNADFDAGDLSRVESLRRASGLLSDSPRAAALFGSVALRWGIRFRDQSPLPGYHRVAGDSRQDWDELAQAEPEIRLLRQWREEPGPVEAFATLSQTAGSEMVIESGVRTAGRAPEGRVRVLEKTPERLLLETESQAPSWIFVLRGYWTYRSIRIDGAEVSCRPAQLAFSAVPVPAGRHRMEWEERLAGGSTSRFGPIVFVLGAVTLIARDRRLLRRASGGDA